jgi:hypothetical protein
LAKRQKKKYRKPNIDKTHWSLMDRLHKASIRLPERQAHDARSINNYYRLNGFITPRQEAYAHSLINQVERAQTPRKTAPNGYSLYAISDGAFVKLGYSKSPKTRMRDMQTGQPTKLEILWELRVAESESLAQKAERKLHRYCKAYRKRGEWFELSCMTIVRQFELRQQIETEAAEDAEIEIVAAAMERI